MEKTASALKRKIKNREAKIGVIGLGYVGLPLAVEFADAGFQVTGIDLDSRKVKGIRAGRSHVEDVPDAVLAPMVAEGKLRAQSHYRGCGKADALLISVPTPLRKTKDPDISYIVAAVDQIGPQLRKGQLVVLESTTYPGTTEEIIVPTMFRNGLEVGREVFVAFSPERIDPGRSDYVLRNTPRVIGGVTLACQQLAAALYGCIVDRVATVRPGVWP